MLAASPRAGAAPADDLCKGCLLHVPAGEGGAPRPLVVALHGDGGLVLRLYRALEKAAESAGVILFAPRCPVDLGCRSGSWWQWYGTSGHDPGWLGARIESVAARHEVDPARVYALGYSGGATYLGQYGPSNPTRFAAIAHIAGGMPWGVKCPDCKIPVSFLLGATDPMIVPYTRPLREYYDACTGHEVVWETLRGVTHDSILDTLRAGKAGEVFGWLLAHRAACATREGTDGGDAGRPPEAPDAAAPEAAPPPPSPPPSPAPRVSPGASGCACSAGLARDPAAIAPALMGAIALAARRYRRTGSGSSKSGGAPSEPSRSS